MHRSGTSLLSGVLHRLGVALPGEHIAADHHNPEGYFEWRDVVDLQERLLIDLDRWWPSAQGCLPLPPHWLSHPATQEVRRQLGRLLRQEAAHQKGPWAIKDPRTSRLLPLWLELAAELDIPLRLLLAVRDPAEVACSLLNRDAEVTGMDLPRAQQLWWLHNLEVIHGAPTTIPLAVVDFGRWFSQPEAQLRQLLTDLPDLDPSAEQQQQALALIQPEHRRSAAAPGSLPLHRRVRRLHRHLLQPGRRRWPAAAPPQNFRQGPAQLPDPEALAADPSRWSQSLTLWQHHPAPRHGGAVELAPQAVISLCGLSLNAWQCHLWLQKLPIPGLGHQALQTTSPDPHNLHLATSGVPQPGLPVVERVALNLEFPPVERAQHWLGHLRNQQAIWDPNPARVGFLRALGLPAYWLDPAAPANGWLQQPGALDPGVWSSLLGLAAPAAGHVVVLGAAGPQWDRALAEEESHGIPPGVTPMAYLPGWPELIISNPAAALAQAGWLGVAAARSAQLVWIDCTDAGLDPALAALSSVARSSIALAPPLTPAELRSQLSGQPLLALADDRPSPAVEELFRWELSIPAQAAVVVSLYNYSDRIAAALDSAAAQSQQQLELIVVDDASSDSGPAVVQAWMAARVKAGGHPFVHLRLLRHGSNAGLAAARNTAFQAATAPWCFVLDADNALYPDALRACLELAHAGSADLAVVHPLLAVEAETTRPDELRSLVRPQSWQRERFAFENHVDAMALVRHTAWEAVGGYTHIEGGWEDYDFWCKLISAGFHGLQCPRVLAVYRSHCQSMSHTATNRSWKALSRTLQNRHPWLQHPQAF